MIKEPATIDTILDWMTKAVAAGHSIPPDKFVDAAYKLTVLLGPEQDKLFEMQSEIAQFRSALLEQSKSVAAARLLVEAMPVYTSMLKQKAKIERVLEFVRIAKIQSKLRLEEYKSY